MIIYRLALRLIKYLHLDQLFPKDELKELLLHKKPKEPYKTKLKTDHRMSICISILLSIISFLVYLTIPYAVMDSPCEGLEQAKFHTLYRIAKWLERNLIWLDLLILALIVLLIYTSVKFIWDAIQRTDLKISPWVERGKYKLPDKKFSAWLLATKQFEWDDDIVLTNYYRRPYVPPPRFFLGGHRALLRRE